MGVYSSLTFSLVIAPKCGVRAGAQSLGGVRADPQKHSRRGLFNKRPCMSKIHFTMRWSVAKLSPICLCLLSPCGIKNVGGGIQPHARVNPINKTVMCLAYIAFLIGINMLSFSIKSLDGFSYRGLRRWLEVKVKSHIKPGYWCVCVPFFSAQVTGSFSFTNIHLDPVKQCRRC